MKIHLNSRQGLYEVATYGRNSITLSTKHETFQVPVNDFKAFAGGHWNADVSKEEIDTFLSIVQPEKYKKQFELENKIISLAKRIDMIDSNEPTNEQYEKWWRDEAANNRELTGKMLSIAYQVYSQNLDFSKFQNHKGIKFIIQTDLDETNFRFCWDPYGFVSNGHSAISSIFRADDWFTINGGWIKIIDDNVILYSKSGDYGVYDDAIATECAQKVFPGKKIHSFAGKQWDEELESKFFPLPF